MSASSTTQLQPEIFERLTRITSSHTFQQVDRLKRFLNFVVNEALSGRGDRLKEFVVGAEVFDKDGSFDPRTDPIVRVQARRLRARIAKYYQDEGSQDPWVIDLPRGGYSPTFKRAGVPRAPQKQSITVALASRNTVAVLGFADQSATQDLKYFCDGLSQEIAHRLVGCPNIRLIATERGGDGIAATQGIREISRRLDVAMLIRGSLRRSGNQLRIGVEVIDGVSASYLWSELFDRELGDPLMIQEEIARALLNKFANGTGEESVARRFTKARENLAARNLYLQGRYHMNQRTEGV